jgi:hypothetical protein
MTLRCAGDIDLPRPNKAEWEPRISRMRTDNKMSVFILAIRAIRVSTAFRAAKGHRISKQASQRPQVRRRPHLIELATTIVAITSTDKNLFRPHAQPSDGTGYFGSPVLAALRFNTDIGGSAC